MRIHPEGRAIILYTLLLLALLNGLLYLTVPIIALLPFVFLSFFLLLFVVQFFRNPIRLAASGSGSILVPADGQVVVIEEVNELEFFNDRRVQVSIFMSPLNVHVNRVPIDGEVVHSHYQPGKYLVAWHPKASTDNERATTVIRSGKERYVMVRQIAGAMARRIITYIKEGDQVTQGEELGFIRFGSRVDVLLPLDAEIQVEIGQKVKGNLDVLAKWP